MRHSFLWRLATSPDSGGGTSGLRWISAPSSVTWRAATRSTAGLLFGAELRPSATGGRLDLVFQQPLWSVGPQKLAPSYRKELLLAWRKLFSRHDPHP